MTIYGDDMTIYEDECVGCESCMGDSCRNRHVRHDYCDICGEPIIDDDDMHYKPDGSVLCTECWDALMFAEWEEVMRLE